MPSTALLPRPSDAAAPRVRVRVRVRVSLVRAVRRRLRDAVVHRREGEHELGGAGIVVTAALG